MDGARDEAVYEYIVHFHETVEYDALGMFWRGVPYNEVFKRLAKLHPQLDLASTKEEFIPPEPSTPANEGDGYEGEVNEGDIN